MNEFPTFEKFFDGLWNREPFPWQTMLANRAAKKGWPDAIDLPTASGKTACLDIAVWALAKQAGEEQRKTPRRIWFVVDRRIVVDEAFERAEKIAARLANKNAPPAVRAVADRLLELRGLPNRRERPLAVGRLRGGVLRDDRWARIPSQPAIITSTADQLGSRLLFRGYGHSALAAPIFAGLAGNDSLILLDEAHCARPFLQTLRAVKLFRSPKWSEVANPTPFHVAVLSATPPGEDEGGKPDVFPADENERTRALNHPVLQSRLTATKRAVLEEVKDENLLTDRIAKAAADFARAGILRVGVIVNRVARAMEIAAVLEKMAHDKIPDGGPPAFDVELLTGRIRPFERDWLVREKLHPVLHSSPQRNPDRPLILVSTQCLEVGADFSFDALVTECASLDALRQRFGRLARLGQPETSRAVIFAAKSAVKTSDPIYGEALKATWEFLRSKATTEKRTEGKKKVDERTIDFGFESLRALLPSPDSDELRAMLAPSPDAPILLPAHVDLLCQTAPIPHPDPDIAPFLHGKGRAAAEVRVAFRCDLDPERTQDWPEIVSLCPPATGELLVVPLYRLRQWLVDQTSADSTGDVLGDAADIDESSNSRSAFPFLIYRGREKSIVSRDPKNIRPDDILFFPAPTTQADLEQAKHLGQLLGHQGFGQLSLDLWELAHQRSGRPASLRINRTVLAPWLPHCPPLRELLDLVENDEPLRADLDAALAAVLDWQPTEGATAPLPQWLRELLTAVQDYLVRDLAHHPGGGLILRARSKPATNEQIDFFEEDFDEADDSRSEAPDPIELAAHCSMVASVAGAFANACLGQDAAAIAKLAGDWHDVGKLDPRFQAMLRGGIPAASDAPSLAKSPEKPRSGEQAKLIREAVGLPDNFRHEMLSTQLAERICQSDLSPDDRELLLHLIASHHGHARPLAPVCDDAHPPAVAGSLPCAEVRLTEAERQSLVPAHRLDSGLSDRFWSLTRRYGWWGLAHYEAILRLADWYASEHPEPSQNSPSHERA